MAKTDTKKQLTIQAAVNGAGEVTKNLDSITKSVAGLGDAAADAQSAVGSISGAFDKLGGSTIVNLTSKLSPLIDGFGQLSSQINGLGKGIGGMLGVFGPWAAAIGFVIDGATKLYDVLAEGDKKAEESKKTIDDLVAAYERLGDAATLAGARQQIAADKSLQYNRERVNQLNDESVAQKKVVDDLRFEVRQREIKLLQGQRERTLAGQDAVAAEQTLEQVRKRLRNEEAILRTKEGQVEKALQDLATAKEIAGAAEAARKKEEEARKKEEEAKKKEEAAQREADQRRKEAAAKAAEQARAEAELLTQIRLRADSEIFAAEEHSAQELLDRQTELQLQQAEERIKNEYLLVQAREAIWEAAEAKRTKIEREAEEKRQSERDKWIAEAAKRSAAATAGGAQQTETERRLAEVEKQRELLINDAIKWQSLGEDELNDYYSEYVDTLAALGTADQQYTELTEKLAQERADAEKKAIHDAIKAELSLSDAQKKAADSAQKGLDAMTEGLEAWGKGSQIIQAAQMTAAGIKATCDAIDYSAEAAANFAIGNIAAGVGLAAAAAGKTAAAAAYAKSLAELGFSAFDSGGSSSSAAAAQPTTSSLTGGSGSRTTEINVTMQFAGQAGRLGRYLIDDINAEARTPGGARIESRVLR